MATTTPNFGWSVPTSSDLVKNGATAIETLGDAIDASLVDLKGGTTGQVLAKASGTDMDFVWAADAGAPTSLGYAAGKNRIINGDFYINQRGFTSSTASGTYGFDRFRQSNSGGTATQSAQTFTVGTAPVAGYEGKNYVRMVTASQSGVGDYAGIVQSIEDVRSFAGQTVTVSFWAKASTGTPNVGVGTVQGFGSGGSSNVVTSPAVQAITSSWVRYSFTVAIPSISGKTVGTSSYLDIGIWTSIGTTLSGLGYPAVGVQNVTIDIWGVQVEAGSTATAFQTATGTIQGELAACQRYYWQQATGTNQNLTLAAYQSTTLPIGLVQYPVTMRVTPTLSYVSGTNYYAIDITNSILTFNDVANSLASNVASRLYATTGSSTAGYSGIIRTNNAAAAVGWSAEL